MDTKKIQLAVLFGGRSGEHEVSLMSATSVLSVLDNERYDITPIGITEDGVWLTGEDILQKMQNRNYASLTRVTLLPNPGDSSLYQIEDIDGKQTLSPVTALDVIFPVLHGTFGEDGTLQGYLEICDIAYVGAGVLGASVAMDKGLFKDIMRQYQFPVLNYTVVTRTMIENNPNNTIHEAEMVSDYPLFIKPANLGSSVGITKCYNRSDLYEGLHFAALYDRRVIIEQGINAREIEISVLGNEDPKASVPGEIVPAEDFYSYDAKYVNDNSELVIPARISEETIEELRILAVEIYKAIDCAGMARVDFLFDKESNRYYVCEVNTIPGFTNISMYPKLWDASGLPYASLIDELIKLALERKAQKDNTEHKFRSNA
ncbi:MAG: D-alanine--D-alanine ligase [Anaerolineaceae bacterium]|nr:D-alanine--D-alanine ligase [Anaerolineaceae bacterium]